MANLLSSQLKQSNNILTCTFNQCILYGASALETTRVVNRNTDKNKTSSWQTIAEDKNCEGKKVAPTYDIKISKTKRTCLTMC